jgi:hypothetical protein
MVLPKVSRQMIETVGAVAQLGEHLLCKQGVSGSIPLSSTNSIGVELADIILGEIKFASSLLGLMPVLLTL